MAKIINFPGNRSDETRTVRVLGCKACSNLTFVCVLDDAQETSLLECAFCGLIVGEEPDDEETVN